MLDPNNIIKSKVAVTPRGVQRFFFFIHARRVDCKSSEGCNVRISGKFHSGSIVPSPNDAALNQESKDFFYGV